MTRQEQIRIGLLPQVYGKSKCLILSKLVYFGLKSCPYRLGIPVVVVKSGRFNLTASIGARLPNCRKTCCIAIEIILTHKLLLVSIRG